MPSRPNGPERAESERAGRHPFLVIANRLPVERRDDGWRASPGGLVRALLGVLRERDGVWVGWTGAPDDDPGAFHDDGIDLEPVALSADEIDQYYEKVANEAIWPLYHDALRPSNYDADAWETARAVNRRFAEEAAATAAPGATVWVHDYHLQLVPAMLRELRPDLRIGFFLHIPFPPQELFMRMPWREEVLEGLLGADLLGFQRQVAAENFIAVARRLLDLEVGPHGVHAPDGRFVRAAAYPISIDVAEVDRFARDPGVELLAKQVRERIGNPDTVLLGVDRMDYTKGIEERLSAFRDVIAARVPDGVGRERPPLVFIQLAVPSRENVGDYQQLRNDVEQLVGRINGEFGTLGHPAVHYLHQSVPFDELIALYRAADVMVVTPLRDGMNLVAKEFVASRVDDTGVLVLSEFAGAVDELGDAVVVNPHDPDALAAAFETAITMSADEARRRMVTMRDVVAGHDVATWADQFLADLGGGGR
jgi:trehalose 6-phosphate synthase